MEVNESPAVKLVHSWPASRARNEFVADFAPASRQHYAFGPQIGRPNGFGPPLGLGPPLAQGGAGQVNKVAPIGAEMLGPDNRRDRIRAEQSLAATIPMYY